MTEAAIAIIGAGQLGSRHLQALALLQQPAKIFLVDPVTEPLDRALERWKEVGGHSRISTFCDISSLPTTLDIAIIATASVSRRMVIETLLDHATVRFLVLEKFLFPRAADYAAIQDLLDIRAVPAWVNCPRRMIPAYRDIQKTISGSVQMSVTGSAWGLACNSVHWLDLFSWLTGAPPDWLHTSLEPGIVDSKRRGFVEFNGTISAGGPGSSGLQITSYASGSHPLHVVISTATHRFIIRESVSSCLVSTKDNGWISDPIPFQMMPQSRLTNLVVEELISSGTCTLTPYVESSKLHLQLLEPFLANYNSASNTPENLQCPIT